MTHERDLERLLDSWFADGPLVVADRVIDDTAARIARQGQRPAWRLRSWRFSSMPSQLRLAVVVGALLVAALAGGVLFLGGGSRSSQAPSAPASAAASAAAFDCAAETTGCAGPLAAGSHATANFAQPFEFRVPGGWTNIRDIPRTYGLEVSGVTAGPVPPIQIMTMIAVADQRSRQCEPVAKSGVGSSVDAIIAYVQGHPGLVSSAPVAAALDGYTGRQIDFTVDPTWDQICEPVDAFRPAVLMLTDTGTPPGRAIAYASDARVRWVVLDVNGKTLIVEYAGDAFWADFEANVAPAKQVVDTIHFLPGS